MPASPSAGAIPQALIAAMRDRWAALLPDVTVTYGPANTSNSGDYLMIGHDDPLRADGQAWSFEEDWSTATREGLDGSGYVTCVIFCWDGDSSADSTEAVADRALTIFAAIGDDIDDTPALGVAGIVACNLGNSRGDPMLADYGASYVISAPVHFQSYRRRSS